MVIFVNGRLHLNRMFSITVSQGGQDTVSALHSTTRYRTLKVSSLYSPRIDFASKHRDVSRILKAGNTVSIYFSLVNCEGKRCQGVGVAS